MFSYIFDGIFEIELAFSYESVFSSTDSLEFPTKS